MPEPFGKKRLKDKTIKPGEEINRNRNLALAEAHHKLYNNYLEKKDYLSAAEMAEKRAKHLSKTKDFENAFFAQNMATVNFLNAEDNLKAAESMIKGIKYAIKQFEYIDNLKTKTKHDSEKLKKLIEIINEQAEEAQKLYADLYHNGKLTSKEAEEKIKLLELWRTAYEKIKTQLELEENQSSFE
jgi:hypothetical protein